ncbi:hypothetical protein [Desulfosarcina sp.]|uniref:hypothetical protein n=1 Tax=Desulfosarcina sp. TaxID=2027861 RepID=UPI0035679F90
MSNRYIAFLCEFKILQDDQAVKKADVDEAHSHFRQQSPHFSVLFKLEQKLINMEEVLRETSVPPGCHHGTCCFSPAYRQAA